MSTCTPTPWLLKDMEKAAANKGVVFQAVKDVVQSLVDDDMVHVDKVGTSNWCDTKKTLSSHTAAPNTNMNLCTESHSIINPHFKCPKPWWVVPVSLVVICADRKRKPTADECRL